MKSQYINTVLALIFVSFSSGVWAQKNKLRKAEKQSDNLAYVDAREVYLKVIEKGYTSAQVYENLGDTYYWNSDYTNAAKWYGSLINQFPDQANAAVMYRAAQAFKSSGDIQRANQLLGQFRDMEGAAAYLGTSEISALPFEVTLKEQSGYNSDYSELASRLIINNHMKNTNYSFKDCVLQLKNILSDDLIDLCTNDYYKIIESYMEGLLCLGNE